MKTQMMRRTAKRIVLVLTLCLLTLSLLASCGGSAEPRLERNTIDGVDGANLSGNQMGQIADMLISANSSNFDSREMLVAASRGYDMTASDFDDTKIDGKDLGINYSAVMAVINKANDRAASDKKIDIEKMLKESVDGDADAEVPETLNEAEVQALIKSFQTSVNVSEKGGFFDKILSGIGVGLAWLTDHITFDSYLAGICLFAVIIEILMLPFAIKQQKNTIRQANLRPKEMAIRNKYKGRNDQVTMQKMNQEIQEFYQRENYSPYSGCLQLLLQFPIIIALYNIVIDPLHYVMGQASGVSGALNTYYSAARAAGGMGGALDGNGTIALLSDIKEKGSAVLDGLQNFAYFGNSEEIFQSLKGIEGSIPNFNIGPFNFGLTPSLGRFDILLLVPILTFAAYFLTTKLNRKFMYQPMANDGADARQQACSNGIMDVSMPLMSTFFTFMVPGLVGIYWIFRSLVSLLKQFILSKIMPLPVFTEDDYKQAAREMAGKRVVKKSENVGKVRSLHHIDDEDFEDTRERALARKAAIEEREKAEQEARAAEKTFAAPVKKEERKKGKSKADAEEQDPNETNDNQNSNQE